jgi:hypothetical protein
MGSLPCVDYLTDDSQIGYQLIYMVRFRCYLVLAGINMLH